jgi:starch synthase
LSLHVAHVTSEIAPYVKTGGLADVSAALPKAQARLGHRVTVLAPLYREVDRQGMELRGSVHVPMDGGRSANFYATRADGVEIVFIDHPPFFDRPFPYGVGSTDYTDNDVRFAFLSRAALEYFRSRAQRPDVIHAHDWQTGLVPVYMKTHYWSDPTLGRVPSVFTIHNLAYQGRFALDAARRVDLPAHLLTPEALEFHGSLCYMKGGILFAELLNTVSPRYAQEIQTPAQGYHMDEILRSRSGDLAGILNGVDDEEWDPRADAHIVSRYSAGDLAGKAACRQDLLRTFDLPTSPELPIVGIVSRLVSQKGFDVVVAAWHDLLERPLRMVVVGTGDPAVQDGFRRLAARAPERFAVRFVYDTALAHKLIAGSDMLLMPSRYEPCGLTQMYALRYGTVPVVRATGGLVDTVDPFDAVTGRGTGFRFDNADGTAVMWAIDQAVAAWTDKAAWTTLQQNGMARDFSWSRSAEAYIELYRESARRV